MNSIQCLARAMTPKRPATQAGVGETICNRTSLNKSHSLSARKPPCSTFKRPNSTLLRHTVVCREICGLGMSGQYLVVERHDEVGALISGFNQLLGTLFERQLALTESESRLTAVLDQTNIHLWAFDGRKLT